MLNRYFFSIGSNRLEYRSFKSLTITASFAKGEDLGLFSADAGTVVEFDYFLPVVFDIVTSYEPNIKKKVTIRGVYM